MSAEAEKAAQFPTLDRGQSTEVQDDLRRLADLLAALPTDSGPRARLQ